MLLCYFVTVEFKNEDLKVTRLEIVTLVSLLRSVFALFSAPIVIKLQVSQLCVFTRKKRVIL